MIEVIVHNNDVVDVVLNEIDKIEVEIGTELVPVGEYKHYEGPYQVTPRLVEQMLKTQNLVMDYDVQVATIPVERVANASGGTTVIIG